MVHLPTNQMEVENDYITEEMIELTNKKKVILDEARKVIQESFPILGTDPEKYLKDFDEQADKLEITMNEINTQLGRCVIDSITLAERDELHKHPIDVVIIKARYELTRHLVYEAIKKSNTPKRVILDKTTTIENPRNDNTKAHL